MLQAIRQVPELGAHSVREGPDWGRYVLVCAVLLFALGALAWGLRVLVARTGRVGSARRSLRVIDVLPLGGKQRVCVVRCYDRTFALGVGDKEVSLIAEIDAAVSLPKEPASATGTGFGSVLAHWARRTRLHAESPS